MLSAAVFNAVLIEILGFAVTPLSGRKWACELRLVCKDFDRVLMRCTRRGMAWVMELRGDFWDERDEDKRLCLKTHPAMERYMRFHRAFLPGCFMQHLELSYMEAYRVVGLRHGCDDETWTWMQSGKFRYSVWASQLASIKWSCGNKEIEFYWKHDNGKMTYSIEDEDVDETAFYERLREYVCGRYAATLCKEMAGWYADAEMIKSTGYVGMMMHWSAREYSC